MTRIAPLTGVAFFVLTLISFAVAGDPPDLDASGAEVIEFYEDEEGKQIFSAVLAGWAAVFFVFFAGTLRRVLRRAEGTDGGGLSATAFAGGIIFAVGIAIFAAIQFTLADAAGDIGPETAATFHVMNENFFFPAAIGTSVFMLAAGIAVVKTQALPAWLGWVAVLLGVIAVTPIGFAGFIGLGIWTLVVSILLTMRADEPAGAPPSG